MGRIVRTGLVATLFVAVFGLFALRSAYGRARDAGLVWSEQLLALDSRGAGGVDGEAYALTLNGEPVFVNAASTMTPMPRVLDYFERECTDHAGGLSRSFANLRGSLETLAFGSGAPGFGVTRRQGERSGFVACFSAEAPLGAAERVDRLRQMLATGDLGKLGDFRYVAVEPAGSGSHVVAVWTTGPMMLGKMFPTEGDAPGFDWPTAPRPAGSRRYLSAYAEGAGYGITIYQADGEVAAVSAGIDRSLQAAGYRHLDLPKEVPAIGSAYFRPGDSGSDLVVAAHAAGAGKVSVAYVYSSTLGHSAR